MIEAGQSSRASMASWTELKKISLFAAATLVVLIISFISPYLGAAALGLLLAAVILGINLKWGVLGLLFILPFDPQVELKPGLFFYFDLLFVLPSLVYLWKVKFEKLPINWMAFALVPYLLFAIATTYWRAENLFWFAGYSVRLVIAVLFMATIAGIGKAETIALALGASLIPQVIDGVIQLLIDGPGSLYLLIYPHYEGQVWTERARGLFFTENNFGSYCATISVMLLALGLRTKVSRTRLLCYGLASCGFLGVAASGSRGAWLGAFAGITMLFIFGGARFGAKVLLTTAVVIGGLLAQWISFAPWSRVQNIDTFTWDTRTTMYLAALLLFIQHPFIGVGLTNHQFLMSSVVNWNYDVGNAAHNTYLQLLSENGSIGFLLFFIPIFYLFYKNLKKAGISTTALVSCAGLTVFFVHGLFDFQLMTAPQYLLLFAVIFGLASKVILDPAVASTAEL